MCDELLREYRSRARALIADLEALAESLQTDGAGERSRKFYTPLGLELRGHARRLKQDVEEGVLQSELLDRAAGLKPLLNFINASMTKGEIPIPDPDLVASVQELSLVFQEQRYVGLRTA